MSRKILVGLCYYYVGLDTDGVLLSPVGYELGENRELVVEKKLRGVELGWALGAGIAMLEKTTLTCTL